MPSPKKIRSVPIIVIGFLAACGALLAIAIALGASLFDFNQTDNTATNPTILQTSHDEQMVFRIIAAETMASYQVDELITTTSESVSVTGTTNNVQGDFLIDFSEPALSEMGPITINLTSLTSDSTLRDARLRQDYLESSTFPSATFVATSLLGLPEEIVDGQSYPLQLIGELTIRDITVTTAWTANISVSGNKVSGNAITTIQMSAFGVGPIIIPGFVETSDNVVLSLDFTAENLESYDEIVDVQATATTNSVASTQMTPLPEPPPNAGIDDQAISFTEDIEPILAQKCVSCHLSGEVGYEIFPLETVGNAAEFAEEIAFVTQVGYMPPWMPGPASPALNHDRSLNQFEIEMLQNWAASGGQVDRDSEQILEPAPDGGSEAIRADLVLSMPVVYEPSTVRQDDYRCFLVDPELPDGAFVTGFEVVPGQRSIVHHVIAYQAANWADSEAQRKESEDPRPGWECFGGTNLQSEEGGLSNSIGTWVPGARPTVFPEGTGRYIPPGNKIVIQVHYNTEAGTLPDQTKLILQLAGPNEQIEPIESYSLVAPVEIPCPAEDASELCRREHAIEDQIAQGDENAGRFANGLLNACGKTIADYATQDPGNVSSDCTYRAPASGYVIEASGHMHQLGTSITIELNPDSADAQILLDIPYWDFNWQGSYSLIDPIWIQAGDEIRVTCVWDNSPGIENELSTVDGKDMSKVAAHDSIPESQPRYIIWGEGTRDEMCLGTVSVIAGSPPGGLVNESASEQTRAVALAAVVDYFTGLQPAGSPAPAMVNFNDGTINVSMYWQNDDALDLLEFSFKPIVDNGVVTADLLTASLAGNPANESFTAQLKERVVRALQSDLYWYGNVSEVIRFSTTETELILHFR